MAKQVTMRTYGVDVAKGWLDIYCAATGETTRIDNDAGAINGWVQQLGSDAQLAVEATNRFHERVIESAYRHGCVVYVVDALRLSRYRDAVGHRAKTDQADAVLLARYLEQEGAHLRCWRPLDPLQVRLWRLLKRRATLVKTQVQLRQSLADLGSLDDDARALIRHCQQLLGKLERELKRLVRQLGWSEDLKRSCGVPGIGLISALGLLAAYHRHRFSSADAFVAYLGLDVRVRDSGTFRGRRKLTKRGDPELRRLLYNAAMAACRQPHWKTYYQSLRDRGLSGTAALVALSRKLVRVCYALLDQQTQFNPNIRNRGCATT